MKMYVNKVMFVTMAIQVSFVISSFVLFTEESINPLNMKNTFCEVFPYSAFLLSMNIYNLL